jgi:hypothetical protein
MSEHEHELGSEESSDEDEETKDDEENNGDVLSDYRTEGASE